MFDTCGCHSARARRGSSGPADAKPSSVSMMVRISSGSSSATNVISARASAASARAPVALLALQQLAPRKNSPQYYLGANSVFTNWHAASSDPFKLSGAKPVWRVRATGPICKLPSSKRMIVLSSREVCKQICAIQATAVDPLHESAAGTTACLAVSTSGPRHVCSSWAASEPAPRVTASKQSPRAASVPSVSPPLRRLPSSNCVSVSSLRTSSRRNPLAWHDQSACCVRHTVALQHVAAQQCLLSSLAKIP